MELRFPCNEKQGSKSRQGCEEKEEVEGVMSSTFRFFPFSSLFVLQPVTKQKPNHLLSCFLAIAMRTRGQISASVSTASFSSAWRWRSEEEGEDVELTSVSSLLPRSLR